MSYIRTIPPNEAEAELAAAYAKVDTRKEPVANILQVASLNPRALSTHLEFYRALMFAHSPLSRAEREAIAVAVSATNDCHY
ncbi:MAG: carboxymuconolactone decarboxylase family protein [Myxococcales bacterium]|nr:carboxymuconolactone decarboxylase family protein [Myxococcales bacterium]